MRETRKLVARILLLSLLLHLGDWPYLDEILGDAGPVAGLVASVAGPSDRPVDHDQSALNPAAGYQLLLPLQGLPVMPLRLPAPSAWKVLSMAELAVACLIPVRIDRPPAFSSLT